MNIFKTAFALATFAGLPLAQAGSPNYTAVAHGVVEAGGPSSSPSYQAEASVSQAVAGEPQNSDSYSSSEGFPSVEPTLDTDEPIVFGIIPSYADKNGGDPLTVFGANFMLPGTGTTDVLLDSSFGTNVVVTSPTTISFDSSAGLDSFGNSLGRVDVRVTNNLGSSRVEKALGFTTLLELDGLAQVNGAPFDVRLVTKEPVFYFLSLGLALPGVFFPISPFEGSIALFEPTKTIRSFVFSPGETAITLAVPDDPSLAGLTIDFQALAIDDPVELSGSFSNVLPVPITL